RAVMERPQQTAQGDGLGLEQPVEIDELGAEADAEPSQRLAVDGIERGTLRRHRYRRQAAERFGQLIDEAAPGARKIAVPRPEERRQAAADLVAQKGGEAAAHYLP